MKRHKKWEGKTAKQQPEPVKLFSLCNAFPKTEAALLQLHCPATLVPGKRQNFFAKSKFNILLKVFYVFPRTGAKFAPSFGRAASAAGLAIWPPLVVSPKDKKKHTVFVGIAKIPTNPQTGCVGHTGFHQSRRKFSRPIWTFQDLTFSPGLGGAFLVRVCAKMQFTKPYGCLRRG